MASHRSHWHTLVWPLATAEAGAVSVVVVLVVEVVAAGAASAALAVASVELLTSAAADLVRRAQVLEQRLTAEVESESACIVLRVELRASQRNRPVFVHLSRRGHPSRKVRAVGRLEAQRASAAAARQRTVKVVLRQLTDQTAPGR